jgi:hypothetical protein
MEIRGNMPIFIPPNFIYYEKENQKTESAKDKE